MHSEAASLEETLSNTSRVMKEDNSNNNNNDEIKAAEEEKKEAVVVKTQPLRNPNTLRVAVGEEIGCKKRDIAAGDINRCSKCKGVVSTFSKIDFEKGRWSCDFCGETTETDVVEEEVPKEPLVDYLVESSGMKDKQKKLAVICVDVSGSMSSTMEVGKDLKLHNLNRAQEKRLALERELAQFLEAGANQNFGRNNVQHVSRLECVQAAAHHFISQMVKLFPDHLPVLVTFANDVKVFHMDGSTSVKTGDILQGNIKFYCFVC